MADKREYFRISPNSILAQVGTKKVELLDLSIGGAKFKFESLDDLYDTDNIYEKVRILSLNINNHLDLPFKEIGRFKATIRVTFFSLDSTVESTLARYIMNWQQRRAYLSNQKQKPD